MKKTYFKYLALAIGAISVVVSVVFSNEDTQYIKPLFHICLFAFSWVATKKINGLLAIFLGAAMCGEFLAAGNFESNFKYISLFFTIFFISGIIQLRTVLTRTSFKMKWTEVIAGIVVVTGLAYLIGLVYMLTIDELSEYTLMAIATIAFCIFIASCFYIAAFNKHPKKIYLFITGAGYIIVCLGTLIHELLFPQTILLGIVNGSEAIAQFSFVYFMVHSAEVLQQKKWFI